MWEGPFPKNPSHNIRNFGGASGTRPMSIPDVETFNLYGQYKSRPPYLRTLVFIGFRVGISNPYASTYDMNKHILAVPYSFSGFSLAHF
jgi:hypothetical protein